VKRIDPNKKLDGHRLQDALISLYHSFSSTYGIPAAGDEQEWYEETIPGLVLHAAIGAGWLDFTDDDKSPIQQADWIPSAKTVSAKWVLEHVEREKGKGRRNTEIRSARRDRDHVLIHDWIVERAYLDSFMVLLKDAIAFHLAAGTESEELSKQLPSYTSSEERTALLDHYIEEESRKGFIITKVQVAQRADVNYSTLFKWKNGKLSDAKPAARRISLLLRFNKHTSKRRYYKGYK
jgi:hypothetical protein